MRNSSVSDLFDPDEVLLTAAQIAASKSEYDAWGRQIADIEAKRRARREWLQTVAKLIGPERAKIIIGDIDDDEPEPASPPRGRSDKPTWTSFVESYVSSVNRGVDYEELREAISQSVLGPTLEKTSKSFYGAIGKLLAKGVLIKEDGWLFSVRAYEERKLKKARGELDDVPARAPHAKRASPMGDEILRFLGGRPTGASGKDLIAHLVAIEQFREVVTRNNTSVYNVLTRLLKRGEIGKEGTTYFLPNEKGSPEGDPETGEVGASPDID